MAAVSAPHAPTALTPPSSSHGGQNSWNYSVPTQENSAQAKMEDYSSRPPLTNTNGQSLGHSSSRPDLSQKRTDTYASSRPAESGYLAPARINALNRKDSTISETGSAPDSLLDMYGTSRNNFSSVDYGEKKALNGEAYGDDEDPEHSRWIHRDKLARIESQELQAAGIVLPRARATSKSSRREQSRDQQGNGLRSEQAGQKRQRMGSFPTEEETPEESHEWDLRTPEEAAEDQGDLYQDVSGGVRGVSRIPVCKTSPIPIPFDHLERATPIRRKQSGLLPGEEEGSAAISYPKSRGRSQSIKLLEEAASATPTPITRIASETSSSPTKKQPAKKGTTPGPRTTSAQRPKTRSGGSRDTPNQRPRTRSGELGASNSISKRPEGDPPWLATMYKPDPRLPPDQQLLPTVAKRLQQERWEKEGKFGNTYDTSFRPLNDDEIIQQELPSPVPQTVEAEEEKKEGDSEWPLRGPKSPVLSTGRPGTGGGYSTMPKITQGAPQIQSPRPAPVRIQEPAEDEKKGGCGCCAVM